MNHVERLIKNLNLACTSAYILRHFLLFSTIICSYLWQDAVRIARILWH